MSYGGLPGFCIDRCEPKHSSHDVQAALQNTRIPLVEVGATEDPAEEPELELDDDPANAKLVDVSRVPIIVTVCQARPCPSSVVLTSLLHCCSIP